jgi:hypothetical protein
MKIVANLITNNRKPYKSMTIDMFRTLLALKNMLHTNVGGTRLNLGILMTYDNERTTAINKIIKTWIIRALGLGGDNTSNDNIKIELVFEDMWLIWYHNPTTPTGGAIGDFHIDRYYQTRYKEVKSGDGITWSVSIALVNKGSTFQITNRQKNLEQGKKDIPVVNVSSQQVIVFQPYYIHRGFVPAGAERIVIALSFKLDQMSSSRVLRNFSSSQLSSFSEITYIHTKTLDTNYEITY